jgi:hypothetical protein
MQGAMLLVQSSGASLRDGSCHPIEAGSTPFGEPRAIFEATAPSRIEGAIRRRITLIKASTSTSGSWGGSFLVGAATDSAGVLEYAELEGGQGGAGTFDRVAVWAASGSIRGTSAEGESGAFQEARGSGLTFSPAALPNARYSGENTAQGSFVADVTVRLGY